jgi:predicted metal-binding membrane protein
MNHGVRGAWAHGIRLGIDCALCCSGLMAILLVSGVMNLGAMALVTIAITAERLFPEPKRAARGIGLVITATGVFMIGRAMSTYLNL